MDLRGAVAVVTGGANGIGRATALALGRAGSDVVVADLDDRGGEDAVTQIEGEGGSGLFVHTT